MPPHARTVLVIFFYTFVSSTQSSGKLTISIILKFIFLLFLFNLYLTIDFPIVGLRHLKFNNIGRETDEAIECDVSVSPQVLWSIIKYYPQPLSVIRQAGVGGHHIN